MEPEIPDAATTPRYVRGPGQYCSGEIEFDANQIDTAENATVPCPHCGLETLIFVPKQKEVLPVILPAEPPKQFVQPILFDHFVVVTESFSKSLYLLGARACSAKRNKPSVFALDLSLNCTPVCWPEKVFSQCWHLVSVCPSVRFLDAPQLGHSPWLIFFKCETLSVPYLRLNPTHHHKPRQSN